MAIVANTGGERRPADVNGVRLRVLDEGEGPLVLLLHGFPESAYSWRHQIAPLVAAGYRVVAPEQSSSRRSPTVSSAATCGGPCAGSSMRSAATTPRTRSRCSYRTGAASWTACLTPARARSG
ncbi:alpha/beta fold hydrolase [Pseudonocardia xinjiangensis]|uniref:alpha/beta fold hydrolase n=1 Tax=Pseudonocardia xinjiangensis TaxID=75289 RepID=UPI003D8F1A6C